MPIRIRCSFVAKGLPTYGDDYSDPTRLPTAAGWVGRGKLCGTHDSTRPDYSATRHRATWPGHRHLWLDGWADPWPFQPEEDRPGARRGTTRSQPTAGRRLS